MPSTTSYNFTQCESPSAVTSDSSKQFLLIGYKIILCLFFLVIIIVSSYLWLPARVHYHITERYLFSSKGDDDYLYLGVLIPKNGPYQTIENIDITWTGSLVRETTSNLDLIKISGGLERGDTSEAVVEYDVILTQGIISWEAPVEDFHDLPQAGIESNHPTIMAQASQISRGMAHSDIFNVYLFTSDHLTYSFEYKDCTSKSALKAYEIGSCVCVGYARLMVALSRALGIPSQMVVGTILPDPIFKEVTQTSSTDYPGKPHAWVEYYDDGYWKMADPTCESRFWKVLNFNRIDGRHLSYGEFEQLSAVYIELDAWSLENAGNIISKDTCFRYVATSTKGKISINPLVTVKKGWDGRYLNTLLIWAITTVFLFRHRDKVVLMPSE